MEVLKKKIFIFVSKHTEDEVEIPAYTEQVARITFAKMGYNIKFWDLKIKDEL